jgi:hypothetical protein
MKNFALLFLALISTSFFSCDYIMNKTISGDGKLISEQRRLGEVTRVHSLGNFDIEISQGSETSIQVEADENLLPYILTENKNGELVVRTKEKVNLSSVNKIIIHLTVAKLEGVELTGSGNATGIDTFSGSDQLKLDIEGTGNISLAINTPSIESSIEGTGDIMLSGETKDSKINIAGVGNYKAENLKAENVDVHIEGSGDARLFASAKLDIEIAGSGDVYYHGTPAITQSIAGSGSIKQLP